MRLASLPPRSPRLNPIELAWRSMKRLASKTRMIDRARMSSVGGGGFAAEAVKGSCCRCWTRVFHEELINLVW
jgi:hypothetical protein